MFIFDEFDAAGPVLIPQTSHAWLAWQVADHWGNRNFPRPSPRSETLSAVFLHDSGWSEFDPEPDIDGSGRPMSFDRMPAELHLDIWRTSIQRTVASNRYAGLLVATHFLLLLGFKTEHGAPDLSSDEGRLVEDFRSTTEALVDRLQAELQTDARYSAALADAGFNVNKGILGACDRVSVHLCAALGGPFEVVAPGRKGPTTLRVSAVGERQWRMHPWPFTGDRLRLQCEGKRLATAKFGSRSELLEAMAEARAERLDFTLLRSSAVRT